MATGRYNRGLMNGSNHWRRGAAVALLLATLAPAAHALDAIVLEVRELKIAGVPVNGASVRLDVLDEKQTRLSVNARSVVLPDPAGTLTNLALVCAAPVVAEPRYGCTAGRFTASGGPTGALAMNVAAELRSDTG